jgi:hypothetical protein
MSTAKLRQLAKVGYSLAAKNRTARRENSASR